MDIHKPKPWHSLREFLKEYLIIVVGVLTALGAEQVAEWAHWRHETHLAREALAFDLRRLIGAAASKDASMPCVAERLGGYSDVLDRAQATGRLPPIGFGGWPPGAAWSMRSWEGLTSGQTLAHMSNRDQITLSGIAGSLDWLRRSQFAERDAWGALKALAGPGRPISEAEIASLRAEVGRASFAAADQRSIAQRLETAILQSGFLTRGQVEDAYRDGVAQAAKSSMCLPTPPPAASSRDAITKVLTDPPVRPGQAATQGVGVHGAPTLEH